MEIGITRGFEWNQGGEENKKGWEAKLVVAAEDKRPRIIGLDQRAHCA
jgi:hypothetical protein